MVGDGAQGHHQQASAEPAKRLIFSTIQCMIGDGTGSVSELHHTAAALRNVHAGTEGSLSSHPRLRPLPGELARRCTGYHTSRSELQATNIASRKGTGGIQPPTKVSETDRERGSHVYGDTG